MAVAITTRPDRKSTRLNSSHTEIYTLSLHDALPICQGQEAFLEILAGLRAPAAGRVVIARADGGGDHHPARSEEHTSELQSHRDLHSFPTRRSSDLPGAGGFSRDSRRPPGAGRRPGGDRARRWRWRSPPG